MRKLSAPARKPGSPESRCRRRRASCSTCWHGCASARRILEIGTLAGYSAIWLGRALPKDGRLVSLEIDPRHARVALANISRAGLTDVVEIRLGRALDLLAVLADERQEPFDMAFIDADKESNPDYFEWALRLCHLGSVIVIDNVVRAGGVADPASDSPAVAGVRRLIDVMAAEPRVSATAIQTVGLKGYDGFAVALVVDEIEPQAATSPL